MTYFYLRMGEELARLQQEVVRLSQELDQTISEKEQAAQYGLVLLEEKDGLEARCQVSFIKSIKPIFPFQPFDFFTETLNKLFLNFV